MTYRNKFEEQCARLVGPAFQYESTKLPYTIKSTYLPDFIDLENQHIIEAKGYFRAEDRRKIKAIKEQYPTYTVEVWFQNPNKTISKSSKTTYAKWCEKNGIKWREVK